MEVKCEYCGSYIPDDVASCPNCGAPNSNMNRSAGGTPRTIAELEQWYRDRGLPPYETTRFFIGIDYRGPKAFGIYKDGDRFIVYKNKADGSRAIRYSGSDEDYAVNELYLKLKSEILNQRECQEEIRKASRRMNTARPSKATFGEVLGFIGFALGLLVGVGALFKSLINLSPFIFAAIVGAIILHVVIRKIFHKPKAAWIALAAVLAAGIIIAVTTGISRHTPVYYSYNTIPYVWYDDNWYWYDYDTGDYSRTDDVPFDAGSDYRVNGAEDYGQDVTDFKDSYYYSSWSDSTISGNSGSSWNWDDHDYDWNDSSWDWDFDFSDWSSDW